MPSEKKSPKKSRKSATRGKRLEGRTAIVTGAGQGIGEAIALAIAEEGANVVVCARATDAINAVADKIKKRKGSAVAVTADVTKAEQVQMLVDRTLKEYGAIDILINNAGGMPHEIFKSQKDFRLPFVLWDWPESLWDKIQQTNLKSAYLCLKAVMPHMIKKKSGHIINAASMMGLMAMPGGGGYSVSKFGIVGLTRAAGMDAHELRLNVRINAVAAGLIDTPGQREILSTMLPESQFPPMGKPEWVASAVIYLLCDAPETLNGQILDIFTYPLPEFEKAGEPGGDSWESVEQPYRFFHL
jgi:NAD(P)-dependent dehydrogenase (short-subunit alcohol dehydrogenase family)